ncbi:MAG: SUMF1/EgtB/PvdO family nonheme iron enzyme [Verrucomicrobia bacterium]|nr:SUMF1/EgtB/PvdO family nonheme iron enzyme [Verrucomicrobiota bacterium]
MAETPPTPNLPADEGATVRAPAPEVVFNRYDLLSELGKGGMGIVWLALDRELNARVALKFLREEMTSEDHALKELKGEVLINRDLAHPNIIKTFDFVTDSRRSAISMEFVDGTNLHKLKLQRPQKCFEVEDVRRWIYQLCDAMHYAHSQRVVHRDIKPANLMVNDRGDVKLGDFGIGRTVADTVNRVTRNAAGTPPFMSPQQTMGEKATPADDIYSIGATIYDLLTGEPPFFRGAIREQTLAKVPPSMTERRKELGRTGETIPEAWERAVAACLAKEPAGRPPSAHAIRELLEGKSAAPSPRRAGPMLAVAGVVVVAVGAAGLYFWTQRTVESEPAARVRTSPAVARPAEPAAKPGDSVVAAPTTAPATVSPANAPGPAAATPAGLKTPVDDLIESGGITREEGATLNNALRSAYGDAEKALATRLLIDHTLTPDLWRAYSGLVPTGDPVLKALRSTLAAGAIKENEFAWLRAALDGRKGEPEKKVAAQLVLEKILAPEQWRTQTDLYPELKRDPLMEKIKPFVTAGAVTEAEGQWLRSALAGEKAAAENALAAQLIDAKTLTTGQWRARTAFSYLLKDEAEIDPNQLPPALDLVLGPKAGVRLLRIDAGTVLYGSPRDELGRRPNESEPRRAEIAKPFFLGKFEVTQAQYESLMPRSPSFWRNNPTWPIDQVVWQDVTAYLAKLNAILAKHYGGALVADLPTEEEWEYACRAGTETAFNNGRSITSIGRDPALDGLANYGGSENGSPKPVGSFAPNAWGLYDMHGNVLEWCKDRFQRGGHWQSRAADCRAAARTQSSADAGRSNKVGFRLAIRYRPPGGGKE